MSTCRPSRGVWPLLLLAFATTGCFTDAEGQKPSETQIYFPTGVLMSPGGNVLYIANSDFDLQYSGGSVQALEAAALRKPILALANRIAQDSGATSGACAEQGLRNNQAAFLQPGPCSPIDIAPFIRTARFIGAFASGLMLTHEPNNNRARLFAPVRGDPSITYFDVDDDRAATSSTFQLDCATDSDGFCGSTHRIGQDRDKNLRGLQLPADPVGIAASTDGVAIVSAHQTQQAASVLVNSWEQTPELSYFIGNLPPGPTEIASVPEPAFVAEAKAQASSKNYFFDYRSTFAMTYRSASVVSLLQYVPDAGSIPPRPFIVRSQEIPISVGSSNVDSRGLAIVNSERKQCESQCSGQTELVNCLAECAEQVPLRVYLSNRRPASLLIGRIKTVVNRAFVNNQVVVTGGFETISFHEQLPLSFGASRVEVGNIVTADGTFEERIFAVCFDARSVFIINPKSERLEHVIRTGRGPHDIAVDAGTDENGDKYSLLYIGHFTDSYLGAVDLDVRRPHTYGQLVASLGVPTPPVESR
jgi:hypothetical protein